MSEPTRAHTNADTGPGDLAGLLAEHDNHTTRRTANKAGIVHYERECLCGYPLPWGNPEDEHRAHLAAVIEAAGWRQVPSARVGTEPRATVEVDVEPAPWCANYVPPLTCLTAPSSETGRCDACKAAAVPEAGARLTEDEAIEILRASGDPMSLPDDVLLAVERILAARLAGYLSPEQAREPIIRYAEINGAEEFDEFVAHNATVHFEAMGRARWWAGITLPDGRTWHLNFGAVNDRVKFYANCEEEDR